MKYAQVSNQYYHVQGYTTNGKYIWWSFTDTLVQTSMNGTVLRQIKTPIKGEHLGGVDYYDGKIYGACMGGFVNGSSIHVYDAETLALLEIWPLRNVYEDIVNNVDGVKGIGCISEGIDPETGDPVIMAGAALINREDVTYQVVYQYSLDGKFQKKYRVPTGPANLGIQNLDRDPETGEYWMAAYGWSEKAPYLNHETLYRVSPDLTTVTEKYVYSSPYGLHCLGGGRFYTSAQSGVNGHRDGYAFEVDIDFIRKVSKDKLGEEGILNYVKPMFDAEMGL